MDDRIRRALSRGHLIDITTIGRRSGTPHRIELVFHNFDGRIYITGMPNPRRQRDWLLNLAATPQFTFHLKGPIAADLPATARVISDPDERRAVFGSVVKVWRNQDVQTMTAWSPLVEVSVEGYAAPVAA